MNSNWAEERVDAYVDGDLSRDERRVFERSLRADPALGESLRVARDVKVALRGIPSPACPRDVSDAILGKVRADAERRSARRSRGWSIGRNLWQPAGAVVALLVIGLAIWQPWQVPPPPPAYAQAEVDVALDEVKWTLAYLNGLGSRTGATIRDEVITERVMQPIERGLGLTPSAGSPR